MALAVLSCKHMPFAKHDPGVAATVAAVPDPRENKKKPVVAAPIPDSSAAGEKQKRVGLLRGIFHNPVPAPEAIAKTGSPPPIPVAATPEENIRTIPDTRKTAPAEVDQAKPETKVEAMPEAKADAKVAEDLPPAKAGKKTLFANLFKRGPRANEAKPEPAARKKPGFHWPWSKAGPAVDAAPEVADAPAPKPENIPYGLPATPLPEIKPREPETGLAPAPNAAPPSGKKADPIDDIGLYPEQ